MTAVLGNEVPADSSRAASGPTSAWRHRGDIQGLRAVAVLLVLAHHAGVPGVSAGFVGVDVFFVISGFLITGLLVKEVERSGTVNLPRFYARRVKRLLPAAGVVLAFVALMTVLVLPETRWRSIVWDVVTSAFYVVNWRLADQSVDYLAQDQAASPVQHFWSLAVEEQFYVIWPLLILAAVFVHRRFSKSLRLTLGVGLALVAVPSLIWSVYLTQVDPGPAYFVTTTRLWELAIGAALALCSGWFMQMPRLLIHLLGWGGLVAIAAFAVTATASTPFPGSSALIPTLGSAAVLAAGIARSDVGAGRFLSWSPAQDIGALSYSLYLWHWPVIVAGAALWGREDGSLWWVTGSVLAAASAVPAWLTYKIVEAPIHKAPVLNKRPMLVVPVFAVSMLIPVIAVAGIHLSASSAPAVTIQASDFGAAVLGEDPGSSQALEASVDLSEVAPALIDAPDDNADVYADGCHQDQKSSDLISCTYGDEASGFVVALVGDSHAAQWQPALAEIAVSRGFKLVTYTKSACGFFSVDVVRGDPQQPYTSCSKWNDNLVEELTGAARPDLVVTSGSNEYSIQTESGIVKGADADRLLAEGYAQSWQTLLDVEVKVAVLPNTPWVGVDVPECLAEKGSDPVSCAVPIVDAMKNSGDEQQRAAELVEGEHFLDLNEWVCPTGACPPVIGDVIVWRDTNHLTATYARSLAPVLERQLLEAGVLP